MNQQTICKIRVTLNHPSHTNPQNLSYSNPLQASHNNFPEKSEFNCTITGVKSINTVLNGFSQTHCH
jgi:hypothetical protein